MRHGSQKAFLRVGCAFSLMWLASSVATAAEPSPSARAQIGFGSTLQDSEIQAVLAKQSVAPTAVFMWSAGFTGTYRSYDGASAGQLLKKARIQAIQLFTKASQSNREQILAFQEKNSEAQLVSSEALQTQARSLINAQSQIEAALRAAKGGQPLVFAVDVSGDATAIEKLRSVPEIKAVERIPASSAQGKADANSSSTRQRAIKPAAYNPEYLDPQVQTISPSRLYPVMQAAGEPGRALSDVLTEVGHASK